MEVGIGLVIMKNARPINFFESLHPIQKPAFLSFLWNESGSVTSKLYPIVNVYALIKINSEQV